MKFIHTITLAALTFGAGCSNEESVDLRKGEMEFIVQVDEGSFGLLGSPTIQSVSGGFSSCEKEWKIAGSSGSVVASSRCGDLVYKSLAMELADQTFLLDFGGKAFRDMEGNEWRFGKREDGRVAVYANFNSSIDSLAVTVGGNFDYGIQVAIDEGDGPVCLASKPFSVSVEADKVWLSVTPPTEGFPAGTELTVSRTSPEITIDSQSARFVIDLSGKPDGIYTFGEFAAKKGMSSCRLTQFVVTVGAGVPLPAEELHVIGTYGRRGSVDTVTVDTGTRVTLLLSSYENISWDIKTPNGSIVEKVILAGYGTGIVTGVDASKIVSLAGQPDNPGYAYKYPSTTFFTKVETLTGMKIASSQLSYETSQYLVTNVQSRPLPANAEVHLIGAYEGNNATITVAETSVPVVLVIASYEAIDWKIVTMAGAKVDRIIYYSHQDCYGIAPHGYSSFAGVPASDIQRLSYGQLNYFYDAAGSLATKSAVEAMLGKSVTSTKAVYTATSIVID